MAASGEIHDLIAGHIAVAARKQMQAVETACETALQGGEFGVMVDYNLGAWVDPRVPYGQLWDVTACGSENVQV
jgi:hypothetical protein